MDVLAIVGILIGLAGILLGQTLEGGSLGAIIQPAAALIVIGGTLGATLLAAPRGDLIKALKMTPLVF
jgi:chemotaxis protein MotA